MSSLGSLVVSLAANTAQFTSDLGKAAHEAAKRMDDIKKSASMAGKAIGAAFVAGAGTAAVLVKQAIDSADAMTKMAQKAGVGTEAFSTLAYAAQLSGVEASALQTSMSKLGATISDVASGAKTDAAAAFTALGISAKDASGNLKNSDAIMKEVATKFAGMEDGAGKSALAIKIFGKSGADLIPMLNQGAAGLEAMQAEAKALGVELDGSTGAAAERFNDNLTRLNTVKKGFANQIMKAVLPSLEGLTNRLIESAKSSGSLEQAARAAAAGVKILMSVGAIVVGVFKSLGEYLGGVAATLVQLFSGNFKAAFETGKSVVLDFAGNVKGTIGTVSAIWNEEAAKVEGEAPKTGAKLAAPLIHAAEKAGKASTKFREEVDKMAEAVGNMLSALSTEANTIGKTEEQISRYRLVLAGATQEQIDQHEVLWEIINAKKAEQKVFEDAARVVEETRTPYEQYTKTIEGLNVLLEKGAINWDTYGRAIEAAQKRLEDMQSKGNDSMADLKKAVEGWGNRFTDTFVDGVMKGKLAFKDLANSIIADILRIIVKKQVLNALGDFGGGGKSGFGLLGAIGSFFGGGKALGGSVKAGTSYLVGERGPELFTPKQSGHITPNHEMQQQQPVVVHQYFTVGDVASVSMVRQAVAGSEKRIASAMGRSMNYGGPLS